MALKSLQDTPDSTAQLSYSETYTQSTIESEKKKNDSRTPCKTCTQQAHNIIRMRKGTSLGLAAHLSSY